MLHFSLDFEVNGYVLLLLEAHDNLCRKLQPHIAGEHFYEASTDLCVVWNIA